MRYVLLPGLDGTGELFSGFTCALCEQSETTTVRYPAERYLSYAELENLVRKSCPISEPYVLIAESYSTPLAIKYAASAPEGLRGLVLCAGFATSPVRGWRRLLASFFAPVMFYLSMPNLAARTWLVGADATPTLLCTVLAAIASVQPEVLAGRLRAVLACNVRGEVAKIKVPTLYIRAQQDRLVSASCSEELKRLDPRISITTLAGPHLLLQRQPKNAAEAVLSFVQSHCSS